MNCAECPAPRPWVSRQEWGGTALPWMGAGWTPVTTGADGATSLITRQGSGRARRLVSQDLRDDLPPLIDGRASLSRAHRAPSGLVAFWGLARAPRVPLTSLVSARISFARTAQAQSLSPHLSPPLSLVYGAFRPASRTVPDLPCPARSKSSRAEMIPACSEAPRCILAAAVARLLCFLENGPGSP